MQAAVYVRVSTEEQASPGHYSIPEQLSACEGYCQSKGYTIVERFVDPGASGTRSHRPELDRMLKAAREKRFQVIVAYNVDRLARGILPLATVWQVTQPLGIRLDFVSERYEDSAYGEFSLEIRASFGKLERALIGERTFLGRLGAARAGRMPGGLNAFGYAYDKETRNLKIDEVQAGVVRHLFSWVDQGRSIASWVKLHNTLGTPTAKGSPKGWSRQQALKILKNPLYAGTAWWNRSHRKDNARVGVKPQQDWVGIPVPSIVSQDLFQRIQHRLQDNKRCSPRHSRTFYLLQHLLRCRVCGTTFRCHSRHITRKRTKQGLKAYPLATPYRYYECRGTTTHPGKFDCRRPAAITAKTIESLVWQKVSDAFQSPESLKDLLAVKASRAERKRHELEDSAKRAEESLKAVDTETQRLLTLARKGLVTEEEMEPQMRTLREQRQHFQVELAKAREQMKSQEVQPDSLEQAKQFCSAIGGRLKMLSDEEKRDFLRLVLDAVWVDGQGNIEIVGIVPSFAREGEGAAYASCEPALSLEGEGEENKKRGLHPLLNARFRPKFELGIHQNPPRGVLPF